MKTTEKRLEQFETGDMIVSFEFERLKNHFYIGSPTSEKPNDSPTVDHKEGTKCNQFNIATPKSRISGTDICDRSPNDHEDICSTGRDWTKIGNIDENEEGDEGGSPVRKQLDFAMGDSDEEEDNDQGELNNNSVDDEEDDDSLAVEDE